MQYMEKRSRGRGKRPCPSHTPPTPAPNVEGEDIEKKMEEFYSLLDSIRAMRDLIKTNKDKRRKTELKQPLWRPTFELEDFNETAAGKSVPCRKEEEGGNGKEEEDEENNHVDLSLSL
ncbi:NRR repressor [Canna indica]|uniref:NRR repressor n=1 Tax=Canna indica TaxID=4628 RepID=A0AAQ3JPP5_9LILI|nr:NRR repressor [Canna indica]